MTEEQIKHMVHRFLGWKLPESFAPDGGVTFKRVRNEGQAFRATNEPTGTNILDAVEAEGMVRYMLAGLPQTAAPREARGLQDTPLVRRLERIAAHADADLDAAVEDATRLIPQFWVLLYGIDAFMERRRRREALGEQAIWNAYCSDNEYER